MNWKIVLKVSNQEPFKAHHKESLLIIFFERNDEIFLIGEISEREYEDPLFYGMFKLTKKNGYHKWQYFGSLSRYRGEYFPQTINEMTNGKFLMFPERYIFNSWRTNSNDIKHETAFFINLIESFEPNQDWIRSQIQLPFNITHVDESNKEMQLYIVWDF